MAYGDYSGPDKADKGHEGGSCNRRLCQDAPANWYNHGSLSWYCASCRRQIQFDHFNHSEWENQKLEYPMFETREMMDARMKPPTKIEADDE